MQTSVLTECYGDIMLGYTEKEKGILELAEINRSSLTLLFVGLLSTVLGFNLKGR